MKPREALDTLRAVAGIPRELARLRDDLNAMILERTMLRELIATLAQARLVRASVLLIGEAHPGPSGDSMPLFATDGGVYAIRSFSMKPGELRREWWPLVRPVRAGAFLIAFGGELRNVRVGDRVCNVDPPGPEHGGQLARLSDPIPLGVNVGFELKAIEP